MTHEYLIRTANPAHYFPPTPYDPPLYRGAVQTGTIEGDAVLTILHTEDPTLPGDTLVGGWNHEGQQVAPLDLNLYEQIRPLGNAGPRDLYDENGNVVGQTRGGDATPQLLYSHWAGWKQRQLGTPETPGEVSTAALYPEANQPFGIVIAHYWYDQAEFSGWGFLAEIWTGAEAHDPGVSSLGIYSDPSCESYLWTPGGAVQMASRLGKVDDTGNPVQVYGWETPAGQRTQEKQDWHLAVLRASEQRGYQTLHADQERITYNFWDKTQGQPPSGSSWVDTGATVVEQAGQLFRISDAGVAAGLVPGQSIRFGDTLETTFTGLWSGGADYLEIDPYVAAQVGDTLWSWE